MEDCKVNDRVKIIKDIDEDFAYLIGEEGYVQSIDDRFLPAIYDIKLDNYDTAYNFRDDEFEKMESKNTQLGKIIMDKEGYLVVEFAEYVDDEFTDNERQVLNDKANEVLSIIFDVLERVCSKDGVKNG